MRQRLQNRHAEALRRLRELGLKSYSRLAILLVAAPENPVTAAEVVDMLDIPYKSGTALLNDMRKRGHVEAVRLPEPRIGTRGAPTTVAWRRCGEAGQIVEWAYEEVSQ